MDLNVIIYEYGNLTTANLLNLISSINKLTDFKFNFIKMICKKETSQIEKFKLKNLQFPT